MFTWNTKTPTDTYVIHTIDPCLKSQTWAFNGIISLYQQWLLNPVDVIRIGSSQKQFQWKKWTFTYIIFTVVLHPTTGCKTRPQHPFEPTLIYHIQLPYLPYSTCLLVSKKKTTNTIYTCMNINGNIMKYCMIVKFFFLHTQFTNVSCLFESHIAISVSIHSHVYITFWWSKY